MTSLLATLLSLVSARHRSPWHTDDPLIVTIFTPHADTGGPNVRNNISWGSANGRTHEVGGTNHA